MKHKILRDLFLFYILIFHDMIITNQNYSLSSCVSPFHPLKELLCINALKEKGIVFHTRKENYDQRQLYYVTHCRLLL